MEINFILLYILLVTSRKDIGGTGINISICTESNAEDETENIVQTLNQGFLLNVQPQYTNLKFHVKTCQNAEVVLFGNSIYSINIGSKENTRTEFEEWKNCDKNNENCDYDIIYSKGVNIVSCHEWQPFWISWKANLKIGNGMATDHETVLESDWNVFAVESIGLRTGSGYEDRWIFNTDDLWFKIQCSLLCNDTDTDMSNRLALCQAGSSAAKNDTDDVKHGPSNKYTNQSNVFNTFDNKTINEHDNMDSGCLCPCRRHTTGNRWKYLADLNLTREEMKKHMFYQLEELKESIKYEKKNTSSYLATKISARDNRLSSEVIGWTAACVLGFVLSVPVIIDVLNFFAK